MASGGTNKLLQRHNTRKFPIWREHNCITVCVTVNFQTNICLGPELVKIGIDIIWLVKWN